MTTAEPFLAALNGLSATHLFCSHLQKHGWLKRVESKFVVRIVFVILILATALNGLDLSSMYLLDRLMTLGVVFNQRIALLNFASWFIVLVAWVALYSAIHELRRRWHSCDLTAGPPESADAGLPGGEAGISSNE